jgi:large subunit ribosomal protein L9
MKVILNSDVEGKGEVGDIVEVKPGFARNYLFPRKLALEVNRHNLDVIKAKRKKIEKRLEIERLSAKDQKLKLEELILTIEKKAGENDVLFGSVTTQDIEKKLSELGAEIDRKKIHLEEQIKRLGHYSCKIKLMRDVEAEVKIEVVAEGRDQSETPEDQPAAREPDEQELVVEEVAAENPDAVEPIPDSKPVKKKKKEKEKEIESPEEAVEEGEDSDKK